VKKIRLLLKDEEFRASLEQGAGSDAEANAWSKVVGMHLEVYGELVKQG
jgi:hypothetical protein